MPPCNFPYTEERIYHTQAGGFGEEWPVIAETRFHIRLGGESYFQWRKESYEWLDERGIPYVMDGRFYGFRREDEMIGFSFMLTWG